MLIGNKNIDNWVNTFDREISNGTNESCTALTDQATCCKCDQKYSN